MNGLPLHGIETEASPVGKRVISSRERAFQHEIAHGAMRDRGGGLQRALAIARQTKIELSPRVVTSRS
jgi:hypothetical protein